MKDKPVILIIGLRCPPEIEERFNTWYDEIHMPNMLKFKGLNEATRYRIVNEDEECPNYLAVYKFENLEAYEAAEASPEAAATREEADETKGTWNKSEPKWVGLYESLKTWKR